MRMAIIAITTNNSISVKACGSVLPVGVRRFLCNKSRMSALREKRADRQYAILLDGRMKSYRTSHIVSSLKVWAFSLEVDAENCEERRWFCNMITGNQLRPENDRKC